ncbi:MAG TPA: SHOCT domain-containing protein [Chitinophagaceae bacterium]|nr:SHOCT domain-containing protein [Chitinophagaceae bacterium]
MKKLFFAPLLALSICAMAQESPRPEYAVMKGPELTKFVEANGYITTVGYTVKAGDELVLGKGTLPNKFFAFIYQSPMGYFSETTYDASNRKSLTSGFAGKKVKVKRLQSYGTKRTGYNVVAIVGAGDIVNYWIELDQAIEAGEIIIPEPYASKLDINKKNAPLVIQQNSVSVADEIKKLKELHDSGVLTKEEYEKEKKKLLEKQ